MKRPVWLGLATAGILFLAACGSSGDGGNATWGDLTGVTPKAPDKIECYKNIDAHPNICAVCLHGVAFATTSRSAGVNMMRIPEWDVPLCNGTVKPVQYQTPPAGVLDPEPSPAS